MKKLIFLFLFLVTGMAVQAQCSAPNFAFKSGETLIYDLYFNWKFVWIKVSTASMNTTQTLPAVSRLFYGSYLITRGSKRADKIFVMRDTLMAYTGLDLIPKYYAKKAFEGDTLPQKRGVVFYPNGQSAVKMRYQRDNNPAKFSNHTSKYCAFDMISMLLRARSFDATNMKVSAHQFPHGRRQKLRVEEHCVSRKKETPDGKLEHHLPLPRVLVR